MWHGCCRVGTAMQLLYTCTYGVPNEPKVIVQLHTKKHVILRLLGVMSGCDAILHL